MKRSILALLFLWGLHPLAGGEDDHRRDKDALYLFPEEAIRREEILLLDSTTRLELDPDTGIAKPYQPLPTTPGTQQPQPPAGGRESGPPTDTEGNLLAEPKDLETQTREAEGLLKRYYNQFLSEKRVWEDRNQGSKFSTKNEQNELRLLVDNLIQTPAESGLIRDSEILYHIHTRLGRLYQEREDPVRALRHYQAGLRYRNLSHTEERYLDEKTWKEILDQDSLSGRKVHRDKRNDLRIAEEEHESETKRIHRLGSDFANGKMNRTEYDQEVRSSTAKLRDLKSRLDQARKDYENSLAVNYEPFRKTKSREDAQMFYRIAELIRSTEDKNKEKLKIIQKSSFSGRGVFVLFDYKRNTGFHAYEYFLEISHRLDPSYPEPIQAVAYQFKMDGKKQKAVDYYDRYVALMESRLPKISDQNRNQELDRNRDQNIGRDQQPKLDAEEIEKLADVYLQLAILNADLKRKVIAQQNYEKFLETTRDPSKAEKILYELGRFHEKQIGNLEKAKEYYLRWLAGNPVRVPEKESIAHYGISLREKQDQRIAEEEARLVQALAKLRETESEIIQRQKDMVALERETNRYKRELMVTTNDEALAQYRILQLKAEDLKMEKDNWVTRFRSIPVTRILFRLSEIRESKRDFAGAIEYCRQVLDLGNESEVNYALRNIRRMELTQSDGVLRKPERMY